MARKSVLTQESHGHGDGFLAHRQEFAQVFLSFLELRFFGFSRLAILGELGLDFVSRGFGIDRFLEGVEVRIGFGAEWTAALRALVVGLGVIPAASAASSHHHAHPGAGRANAAASFGDLRDPGLDSFPFGVIGDFEGFAVTLHHASAHLFGVEITASRPVLVASWSLLSQGKGPAGEEGGEAEEKDASEDAFHSIRMF